MNSIAGYCLLFCSFPVGTSDGIIRDDSRPGPNNGYRLYQPKGPARGLVVLLPGFGDTVEFFEQYEFPQLMQRRGYLVAAFSTAGYLVESEVETLFVIISDIVKKYKIPPGSTVIGGFSAGGTGAV